MTAFATIQVADTDGVCRIRLDRPEAANAINETMVREMHAALDGTDAGVVVLEGLPDAFCTGADFSGGGGGEHDPAPLFDLWARLADGPYVSVAHVRGRTVAGGVGFVAACDVVIAEPGATFSLSELLFGLFPAMVLPFLRRRVGDQRAHYLTLTTKPITAAQAEHWGLADVCDARSTAVLAQHLGRLRKLPRDGVAAYKSYRSGLAGPLTGFRDAAVGVNRRIFADRGNVARIQRFVEHGIFPWEQAPSLTGSGR